jgi:hypothetical protein
MILITESFVERSPFKLATEITKWVNGRDDLKDRIQAIVILPNPQDNGEFAGFVFYWS